MKTFTATFLAILTAAAVILAVVGAKSRLDKWTDAKIRCVVEINSMSETVKEISDEPISTLSEHTRSFRRMSDIIIRMYRVERDLISLLENKPFGLPLNKGERKLLGNTRADFDEETKKDLSSVNATPSPTSSSVVPEGNTASIEATPPPFSTSVTADSPTASPTSADAFSADATALGVGPVMVTIVKPVTVQMTHGSATLSPGMKLPMVSRGKTIVQVRYLDSAPIIPISATDAQ